MLSAIGMRTVRFALKSDTVDMLRNCRAETTVSPKGWNPRFLTALDARHNVALATTAGSERGPAIANCLLAMLRACFAAALLRHYFESSFAFSASPAALPSAP